MTTTNDKNVFGDVLPRKLEVGDVLVGDFGATMMLPAFYQVIAITPSGKSAKVRRLATRETSSDGGWTGTCIPIDGSWMNRDGSVETKRIKVCEWDKNDPYEYVMIRDHFFRPWDGTPAHFDHLD